MDPRSALISCPEIAPLFEELVRVWVARILLVRHLNRYGSSMSRSMVAQIGREISILTRYAMNLLANLLEEARASCRQELPRIYELLDELGLDTSMAIPVRITKRTRQAAKKIVERVLGDADPLKILARLETKRARVFSA